MLRLLPVFLSAGVEACASVFYGSQGHLGQCTFRNRLVIVKAPGTTRGDILQARTKVILKIKHTRKANRIQLAVYVGDGL